MQLILMLRAAIFENAIALMCELVPMEAMLHFVTLHLKARGKKCREFIVRKQISDCFETG